VIPPAWTDVWISLHDNGHIQATGHDVRGRKQYRYHERWSEARGENKYEHLIAFARRLPDIRARIDADMRRQGLVREKVLATIVWLLDTTLIRVGNERYTRDNKSFGLTTLRNRHVDVGASGLKFSFTGKSGKSWKLSVRDRRIARIVRACQDIPGQRLFQYLDEEGARRAVQSQDVNAYIREAAGNGFSAKHFRTWAGTVMAAAALVDAGPFESATQARAKLNRAIDQVAVQLVNTRAVARRCYIHPAVIAAFLEGTLTSGLKAAARRRGVEGLKPEEAVMLHFLEARASGTEHRGRAAKT
jgi:DNA topoisomerase-1